MNELDKALLAVMTADTGAGGLATLSNGGIFQLTVPENTAFNYTVFQKILRTPEYNFGNAKASDQFFYQISHYAVDGNTAGVVAAGTMADRTIALLTNPSLNVSGSSVLSCAFDRSIPDRAERENGAGRWIYSKGNYFEVWLA